MFDDVLIESAGKDKKKGGWVTALISLILHAAVAGAIIAAGYYVKENPEVIEKPISAFIVTSAPPPPPPPPPAASSGASTPRPKVEQQVEPVKEQFRQPREVPQNVPEVANVPQDDDGAGEPGGQVGGVKGGQIGGVVGGQIGGQIGGTIGGQLGGQVGGTGDTPVRVGGNVKAPVTLERVDPRYTEVARKARIQGIVIIEAVIDRQGNVTEARILKGLPMGLDAEALAAIKRWKFKPGTLNGQPVPVYYNLTINFRLES
jgi:periplasmic protein TonB